MWGLFRRRAGALCTSVSNGHVILLPIPQQVSQLPDSDELSWTRRQLLARLNVCMGGRAAEEMIFGEENITSGTFSCAWPFRTVGACVRDLGQKYSPVRACQGFTPRCLSDAYTNSI